MQVWNQAKKKTSFKYYLKISVGNHDLFPNFYALALSVENT